MGLLVAVLLAGAPGCVTERVENPYYRGYDPERAEAHVWVGPDRTGEDGVDDPAGPDGPPAIPPLARDPAVPADPVAPPPPPRDGDAPRSVSIPEGVVGELDGYMATPRTLVGEIVEVDMSRSPFLGQSVFSIDKTAVSRTEAVDERRGVVTIVLVNISGVKTVMGALPQVRFEGLRLVAVDRLILRYWTRPRAERPIHVRAVANGQALVDDDGELLRGGRIRIDAAVVDRGSGYAFEKGREVEP